MTLLRLLLLVALVAILAGWFVFVPRRPSPTGPQAVAQSEIVLRDSKGKELPVTVWHPAGELPANAPLILYSPGWGGTRTQSSVQVTNLASHGFVVVGCDDYASVPTDDPDRGLSLELASDAELAATIERGGRHIVRQADRLLDILRALDAGQAPLLAGRVDLTKVGVLGYSAGGAAGLQAGLLDPRIVAAMNIDGALFGPPADQIGPQAYFLLSSREAFPPQSELTSSNPVVRNYALLSEMDLPRNRRRMERPDAYWVLVEDAEHDDLADGLFAWRRSRMFRTNFERSAMNAAIEALQVAFFKTALIGDAAPLRALVGRNGQSVRWISPTAPAAGAASARQ
jgi:dienelactone hydrolase